MDRKLLDILCCPVTKSPVRPLDENHLARLNSAIEAGDVQYVSHEPVSEPLNEALITEDGKVVYRVDDGIPVMLADRGIATVQLKDF